MNDDTEHQEDIRATINTKREKLDDIRAEISFCLETITALGLQARDIADECKDIRMANEPNAENRHRATWIERDARDTDTLCYNIRQAVQKGHA